MLDTAERVSAQFACVSLLPSAPLTDGVVSLRPWRPEDAVWYADQTDDAEIQKFTGEPAGLDPSAVRAAIIDMHATGSHAGLAVTDTVTGALLGNAGLAASEVSQVGELSYWVAADARGHGVATRAVALLVDWAWKCGFEQLRLYTHQDNVGSQRAAERAGFRRDGSPSTRTVKDQEWTVHWYALTRS